MIPGMGVALFVRGHCQRPFYDYRGGHHRPLLLLGKTQVCNAVASVRVSCRYLGVWSVVGPVYAMLDLKASCFAND
jgi:hypothetical protein